MSQETDTEADSILSDTNTVKSHDSSHHHHPRGHPAETQSVCSISISGTLSESSDSNMSDAEVMEAS